VSTAPVVTGGFHGSTPGPGKASALPDPGPVAPRTVSVAAIGQHRGRVTFQVGDHRYTYVVERGDTLSKIAQQWLGNSDRWPQICQLNKHRHWPVTGGTLRDCDLIYPGWDLRLPADARPPATAAGPSHHRPLVPSSPETKPPSAGPRHKAGPPAPLPTARPATPSVPTPTRVPPTGATAQTPGPTPTSVPPTGPPTRKPTATAASITPTATKATAAGETDAPTSTSDQHGIHLPGSHIPWDLASGIAAAVALVWLHRRRRHTPDSPDDDPTDLPASLLDITHQVAGNPDLPTSTDVAERAAAVPTPPPLPTRGLGLVGDGAHAAARAALTTALASGGPRDPDRQGDVIIDRRTLTSLLGAQATALGPWHRLQVTETLDEALAVLEIKLLHRARILQEHALPDVATLREYAPDEETLPPILLITETPTPGDEARIRTTLGLGADLEITAILLGAWNHGTTVRVDPDGLTHRVDGPPSDGLSDRMGVLDTDTTLAILATLREAHTGHRPLIPTQPGAAAPPAADLRSTEGTLDRGVAPAVLATQPPPAVASPNDRPTAEANARPTAEVKARLAVFGTPRITNITDPGQPLRAKAAELAIFLACHPDGADTRAIGEHLERGVRIRSADTRVHTNVSNLRHVMGRAAGPRRIGYVIKTHGRYTLDPATVDVDLWEQRDLIARAVKAGPSERISLLRQACELATAPLADGCDYDWVEAHREKTRQQSTDAHLLLAEALMPSDPQAASDVLDRAIRLDCYNEKLYQTAMRARHRIGDRDGIRALLQALAITMADLDTEPNETTIDLARRLREHNPNVAGEQR
jgi:DNA-binding SARP family transcriptional activator